MSAVPSIDESSPEPRPAPAAIVTLAALGLGAFFLLGGLAQLVNLAWGLWFSEVVFFLAVPLVLVRRLGFAPGPSLGLGGFSTRGFGLGLAFGGLNYLAWAVPLMALAQAVFPRSMVETFDSAKVFERATPVELALVLVGVSVAAPLCEELFFRGFMQRGLAAHREPARAIVVTAVVFSAFHLDPVGFLARFELGVLFGVLAWRAGSIWPAVGAHAANNALSSALFFAAGPEGRDAPMVWWVPALLFVVGNALLFVLVRVAQGRLAAGAPARWTLAEGPAPRGDLVQLALGVLAAIALLLAVDSRGVALNLIDAAEQPPKGFKERESVKAFRAKARRGEVELDDYRALVRAAKAGAP